MKVTQGKKTITTEIAYISGFFDGEGCVRIKQANQRGNSYYVIAHITNTNKEILEKVKGLFNGQIRTQEKGVNKTIYNWSLSSSEAVEFLRTLSPFLIEKKKQSELAIWFHENKEKMKPEEKIEHYKKMMEMKKERNIYENPTLI